MKKPILANAIEISLYPSWILWGWLVLFSILVLVAIWISLTWGWALSLTMLYAMYVCVWSIRTVGACGIRQLTVTIYGDVLITDKTNRQWRVTIKASSVVQGWLMVLHFEDVQLVPLDDTTLTPHTKQAWQTRLRPHALLILPDQASAAALSDLRRWLKWGVTFKPY